MGVTDRLTDRRSDMTTAREATASKNAKICSKKERNWLVKMFEILSKRLASLQISDYGGSSQETVQPRGEKCYDRNIIFSH